MKKLLVVFIGLIFAGSAIAADPSDTRVVFKGYYDVAGVYADNYSAQNQRVDDLDDADKVDFIAQVFRVQPEFKPADGVMARLRFDVAESVWGQDQGFTTARADEDIELQVDRAYVRIDKPWLQISAGLQFLPLGQGQIYRDNQPGLQLIFKTPVSVRLGYVKVSESVGVGTADSLSEDSDLTEDTDRYFADVGYKSDAFKINAFYVAQKDGSTDGVDNFKDEPYAGGVRVLGNVGSVGLGGELATFGGDNGNGSDYVGTQLNVHGILKVSDALSVKLDSWYSSGRDDTDDIKKTYVGDPFARMDLFLGSTTGWDNAIYGRTGIQTKFGSRGGAMTGDVFDPFNTGAGSYGAGTGAKYTPVNDLTLYGLLYYMTAANNDIDGYTGEFDNGYSLILAAAYELAPKTTLTGVFQRVDANFMDDVDPDAATALTMRLRVAF